MNVALGFTRVLFVIISVFFLTVYMASLPIGNPVVNGITGAILGLVLGALLIGFDLLFKRFNLRSFNIAIVGMFIGYLMGQALVLILNAILNISVTIHLAPQVQEIIKIVLFIFGIYLGTLMTLRSSDELYVSIPFVKFSPTAQKKKDLLVDISVLQDPRILDLSTSGVLDKHLIIPRFVIKDLYSESESTDEMIKSKAKRSLDVLKKLELIQDLDIRYNDTDFPDVKENMNKMFRLARLLDSNILTADLGKVEISGIEGTKVINICILSNALKPLMQAGEQIKIKVQRYGKEPRQGVGYLEDGTMVVINGGGHYIGESIEAQVLSVKHTSSGRMVFCNAMDEEEPTHFSTEYE